MPHNRIAPERPDLTWASPRRPFVLFLAIIAIVGLAWGGSGAAAEPGGVQRATLENGLRVVVVPNKLAPVVTTALTYLVGSNEAPDGFPGTAHALEHMLFRGSDGLDKDQLAELGALLGGDNNAETTETTTKYTFTVPSSDLATVLRIEALRMRGATIGAQDWALERGAIQQEVAANVSSPGYEYSSALQAILFAGTPYAHDALGTRDSFDRTTAEQLRAFYDRWYAPNNAILTIVGDVEPGAALALAQSILGAIPQRPLPPRTPVTLAPLAPRTLELNTNFSAGLIALAFRMPGLKAADFAAADILGDVLGSERGSLYALVPAGKALSARFSYQAMPDVGIGTVRAAFPSGGDPAPVLAELRRVLADIVRRGVAPDLVAAAKRQELAQLAFRTEGIEGLAEAWTQALADQGATSPDDLAKAYAAVTVADVNRMARRLLDPNAMVTAILTPSGAGEALAERPATGSESFARPPEAPVTLPPWAVAALDSLPPAERADLPDVSVLPNGLRLIVRPEPVGRTISVYGHVRQVRSIQEPPGKEGVSALLESLHAHGTEVRDRLALRAAFDAIAARESAGSMFELKVLTPHFVPGMRLLAEHQLRPGFTPAIFAVARRQLAQNLAGRRRTPDYLFRRAMKRALVPDGDPSLRQATEETVMRLTLADIRAYRAKVFRPDLTTIVVVGDVTPALARRVVAETFGGWRAQGPTPAIDLPPVPPSGPSRTHVPDPASVQASVSLVHSLGLPVDSDDRYALMLGNMILGDGFSSRLYQDLRVRTGYVYGVDSTLGWTRTRAEYGVSFGTDPDKVDTVRAEVMRDIRTMQNEPVGMAELTRAKAQMLRQLRMRQTSVASIAGAYLRLIELGLPLDSQRIAAERYRTIEPADIQRAFARWLRPDDLAQIVRGPAPR